MKLLLLIVAILFIGLIAIVFAVLNFVRRSVQRFTRTMGGNDAGDKQQYRQQNTRRTTTTKEGVTIIDQRPPSANRRKIFSDNEGEYVDFKEV